MQQFAIYANVIVRQIGLAAQLRDDLPVHHHAARHDHLLRVPPAGNPRLRQDLLQPFQSGRLTRLCFKCALFALPVSRSPIFGRRPRAGFQCRLRCFEPSPGFHARVRRRQVRIGAECLHLCICQRLGFARVGPGLAVSGIANGIENRTSHT